MSEFGLITEGLHKASIAKEILDANRSPERIKELQTRRLVELVGLAREKSPFYKKLYGGVPETITDIRDLPPVDKSTLMEHFNTWVTDPSVTLAGVQEHTEDRSKIGELYQSRYLVWETSGSTGIPAILLQDQQSIDVITMLHAIRGLPKWFEKKPNINTLRALGQGLRTATVFETGGHSSGIALIEHEKRQRPMVAKFSKVFSVQSPLPELVRELNDFRPAFVTAYATALLELAREQQAGRLHIRPAKLMSVAENLSEPDRQEIESAFGCKLFQQYGASEVTPIALDCKHQRLHVNSDWVIVEPVDENYQPVQAGEISHTTLVTNLANRVQPIIRYDLGDRISFGEPCPCGSPLPVINVEGRQNDVLSFISDEGRAIRILPLAIGPIVEETRAVKRYQLIQTGDSTLEVRLSLSSIDDEKVWEEIKEKLRKYLYAQGLPSINIVRSQEQPGIDPKTGKFRQVYSDIK